MRPLLWTASALAGSTSPSNTLPPLPNVASSPVAGAWVVQVTPMLATSAPDTVPAPLATAQTWAGSVGCVATRTS